MFVILIRRREIELISDGNKLIEGKVIYFINEYYNINMKVLNFRGFMKNYKLKNDTMNELELQGVYNYPYIPQRF